MSSPIVPKIPALLLHLFPIVPFAMGFPFAGIAALLLVGLAYIKVNKLRAQIADESARFGKAHPSMPKALAFWEKLTFLPPKT